MTDGQLVNLPTARGPVLSELPEGQLLPVGFRVHWRGDDWVVSARVCCEMGDDGYAPVMYPAGYRALPGICLMCGKSVSGDHRAR